MGKFVKKVELNAARVKMRKVMYAVIAVITGLIGVLSVGIMSGAFSVQTLLMVVIPLAICIASIIFYMMLGNRCFYLDIYERGFSYGRKDYFFNEIKDGHWEKGYDKIYGIIPMHGCDNLVFTAKNNAVITVNGALLVNLKEEFAPFFDKLGRY
ncbi:MAG: hypothetical protein PHG02_03140 [Oscillospiraceae bacterium]|nr:hypothetical protein [Oscillospiraceae bacterium]